MKIPLSQPDITQQENNEITKVLKSKRLSLGAYTEKFEQAVANFIGVKYAVAVSNGTCGLHLLMRAFEIKDKDEVITTPFSFVASANCMLYERAKPVFVDIEPKTLCIDPDKIEKKMTKKTKAILAVDVFGHPADYQRLTEIARSHNLILIEDSCEALGSKSEIRISHLCQGYGGQAKSETNCLLRRSGFSYEGRAKFKIQNPKQKKKWKMCGSFGDAGVFAFYPNKQITTGEGGIIVTNSARVARLCRGMRNQGRLNYAWLKHDILGYNYRIDEMSSALGCIQMKRIKTLLQKRTKVAKLYQDELNIKGLSEIIIPRAQQDAQVNWFVYVIRLANEYTSRDRDALLKKLQKKGIACSNYFPPIHLQPFYKKKFRYKKGDFPITESTAKRTIALPFYNNLTKKEIKYIVKTLQSVL